MKTYQSSKQQLNNLKEQLSEKDNKIKALKDTLERIVAVYDNVEDFAGVVAKETLSKINLVD